MIKKFKTYLFIAFYIVSIFTLFLIITSCSSVEAPMDSEKTEIEPYTFSFDNFNKSDNEIFNTVISKTALENQGLPVSPVYIKEVSDNEINIIFYLYTEKFNNAQLSHENDILTITLENDNNIGKNQLRLKVIYDSIKISTIRLEEKD